jgi:NAD(P)-dependent dehydrogenase (short-subunit alcohol dehydrogenase family)
MPRFARTSLVLLSLCSIVRASTLSSQPQAGARRAVLVTGASTGIGRKMTEVLSSRGFFVYAGARKEKDLADLARLPNVQPIKLDVTSNEDIAAAVSTVEQAGRGLYGVVNNAGVAVLGALIETTDDDARFVFEVNVLGPLRVTRGFSKLLIASKGRVITTGSISGILAGPMLGIYAMSKHAVEAFTDALAAEMGRLGVKVSVIEPGDYRSDMSANVRRQMQERGQKVEGSMFEKELRAFMAATTAAADEPESDDVALAALDALTSANPKLRYLVTPNQRQATRTMEKQLWQLAELNQGHKYSLSRDSLVAMLDRALARSK